MMGMKRLSKGTACLLMATIPGCTSLPADYAATLPTSDPKWQTPECEKARVRAAEYKDKNLNVGVALLLGPYGLAMAAAPKENSEKQRRRLARNVHMECSSQPLPRNLQNDASNA